MASFKARGLTCMLVGTKKKIFAIVACQVDGVAVGVTTTEKIICSSSKLPSVTISEPLQLSHTAADIHY
jgi:hypothetical protein